MASFLLILYLLACWRNMFHRMYLLALMIILTFGVGCSTKGPDLPTLTKSTNIEAPPVVGSVYTSIIFRKNDARLNTENKERIKSLAQRAHRSRKAIEKIRILAWSDKEYPEKITEKTTTRDILLATERANKIKEYLSVDLKENEDIDAYNMARRPGLLSKLIRNDEFKVKEAFEASGVTASPLPDGQVSFTKASKALVIIDYRGEEDNLK